MACEGLGGNTSADAAWSDGAKRSSTAAADLLESCDDDRPLSSSSSSSSNSSHRRQETPWNRLAYQYNPRPLHPHRRLRTSESATCSSGAFPQRPLQAQTWIASPVATSNPRCPRDHVTTRKSQRDTHLNAGMWLNHDNLRGVLLQLAVSFVSNELQLLYGQRFSRVPSCTLIGPDCELDCPVAIFLAGYCSSVFSDQ